MNRIIMKVWEAEQRRSTVASSGSVLFTAGSTVDFVSRQRSRDNKAETHVTPPCRCYSHLNANEVTALFRYCY